MDRSEIPSTGTLGEYRLTRTFSGLGLTLDILKGSTGRWAEHEGERLSLAHVMEVDEVAHLTRHGVVHAQWAPMLERMPLDELVRVTVRFHLDVPTDRFYASDNGRSHAGRRAARVAIAAALERRRAGWATVLQTSGISGDLRWARYIPAVSFQASAGAVRALSRSPAVALIIPDEVVTAVELQTHDPIEEAAIDDGFNAWSQFGTDQNVGLIEPGLFDVVDGFGSCEIFHDHEAFGFATVVYQEPPGHADCGPGNVCAAGGDCDTCVNSVCTTDHGTAVASVISASSTSTVRSAGDANLFIANGQYNCGSSNVIDAFEWLLDNEVMTVNESFSCPTVFGVDGIVEDWYAHEHGMLTVRAGGNSAEDPTCPYMYNSLCVGGSNSEPEISCFASTENPMSSDREEPDLAAFAGDNGCGRTSETARVAHPSASTTWIGAAGTSFAAPAVTAMAALLQRWCESQWGGVINQRIMRAVFRTSAFSWNPDGVLRYSTPSTLFDFGDGGGQLDARALMGFCSPTGGAVISGGPDEHWMQEDSVDLTMGGALPSGTVEYEPGTPGDEGFDPVADDDPGAGDRIGYALTAIELEEGGRIRFTVSWDSCVESLSPTIRGNHTDFDLFLYNATTGAYVYGSQSFDDVNEGFDVQIDGEDGAVAGLYEVYLAWPDEDEGCSGDFLEYVGWSGVAWY